MSSLIDAPLVNLCRPRTSLGCLFSDTEVACLRDWIASGVPGPALATAPPGSGLTTLVSLLVKEAGLEPVWIGCGTPRIRALLDEAAACPVSATMRRKILVMDEFDALQACDTSSATECVSATRTKKSIPMLFLAHPYRSQKTYEFAKKWPRFAFARPSLAVMTSYLSKVCSKHGMGDPGIAASVAASVKGDVRAALMALDIHRRSASAATTAPATTAPATTAPAAKDEACDPLDLVEAVLRGERGHTVRDCLHMFSMEGSALPMGLFENYLTWVHKDDTDVVRGIADAYSTGDIIDKHMYSKQAWDVYDAYGVHTVVAPSLGMKRTRRGDPKATVVKFGSVWSKAYNSCAKMKNVRALAHAFSEGGHAALDTCDMAFVRACIKAALERGDEGAIRAACAPLTASHVLHLVRLDAGPGGSAWYKQAHHNRVKKALAVT